MYEQIRKFLGSSSNVARYTAIVYAFVGLSSGLYVMLRFTRTVEQDPSLSRSLESLSRSPDLLTLVMFSAFSLIAAFGSYLTYINWRRRELEVKHGVDKSELQKLDERDFEKYEQIRHLREQKARIDFERNLKSTFVLKQMDMHNLSFFADSRWILQPGVNVILGRNGYGKSLLLRSLAALLQYDEDKSAEFLRDTDSCVEVSLKRNAESALIRRETDRFTDSVGKVPILAIPDARFPDRSFQQVGPSQDSYVGLREHGAYHFLRMEPYSGIILGLIYEICLDYWQHDRSFRLPVFRFLEKVFKRLTDEPFEFASIERAGRTSFEISVKAEGAKEPVPIRYASQGTLSVLAIFGLVRSYLKALFPDEDEERIADKPAVVIIDELDAHLHPVWQQRMTGLLREMFPRVQFIVSAHSPLVAAGCLEYEVAVLRKSEGGFRVYQFGRDFIGASAHELYEDLFGIEEADESLWKYPTWKPMDQTVLRRLRQLDELESAGKLTADLQLERSRLSRDDRVKRRVAEVLDERRDENLEVLKLRAEVDRLRARLREPKEDRPNSG